MSECAPENISEAYHRGIVKSKSLALIPGYCKIEAQGGIEMKQYEARVYLGKETYEKLQFIVTATGTFKSVNQLLGVLLKEQAFLDTLNHMVTIIEIAKKGVGEND